MRVTGFLLLISGWILVLAALALLASATSRGWFIAAGVAVEILGIALAARTYVSQRGGGE